MCARARKREGERQGERRERKYYINYVSNF